MKLKIGGTGNSADLHQFISLQMHSYDPFPLPNKYHHPAGGNPAEELCSI
jgi:hypothetical protein